MREAREELALCQRMGWVMAPGGGTISRWALKAEDKRQKKEKSFQRDEMA